MKVIITKILFFILIFNIAAFDVSAESDFKIIQKYIDYDDTIRLYFKGIEEVPSQMQIFIGNEKLKPYIIDEFRNTNLSVETLIMIDNSESMDDEFKKENITTFVEELTKNSSSEIFKVVAFGDSIETKCEFTDNKETVLESIKTISYSDDSKNTFKNLYNQIDFLNNLNNSIYKRIILITNSKNEKFEEEEIAKINLQLEKTPYQIHVVNLKDEENGEKIKKLEEISEKNDSKFIEIKNKEDLSQSVPSLLGVEKTIFVDVILPFDSLLLDGMEKKVKVIADNEDEILIAETKFVMPKIDSDIITSSTLKQESETALSVESLEKTEKAITIVSENEKVKEIDEKSYLKRNIIYFLIVVGSVFLILMIILILINRKKASGKNKGLRTIEENTSRITNVLDGSVNEKTEVLGGIGENKNYEITITDCLKNITIYKGFLNKELVIGRNSRLSDVTIKEDVSISQRHFKIFEKENKIFILDLNSANGTFVNGNETVGEISIESNSIIKIGRTKLKVEYM